MSEAEPEPEPEPIAGPGSDNDEDNEVKTCKKGFFGDGGVINLIVNVPKITIKMKR